MRPNRSTAARAASFDVLDAGDVELDHQQVVVVAQHRGDPLRCAPRGDDRVTSGQRRPGDVDAHATPGAGDEPDLLVCHVSALLVLTRASDGRGGDRVIRGFDSH